MRVDVFIAKGRIYVGEVTFFPVGRYEEFVTHDTQLMLGDMLDLSGWKVYGGGTYLHIKRLRSLFGPNGI